MVDKRKAEGRLAEVSGQDVSIDPAEHYDGWADSYDRELLQDYGYCAHRIAANALAAELPDRGAELLDVGCGTGLVGVELAAVGFTAIDGMDISARMIEHAAETGVYRQLIRQDAGQPSAIPEARYHGVVSAGSFGKGHLGPEALGGLIALVRPGGAGVIFMNAEPYLNDNYESHLHALEAAGTWRVERIEDHNYMDALERPGKLIVARRGGGGT